MPSYLVRWEIEIDAESHHDAAEKALEIQHDRDDSIATVFEVKEQKPGEIFYMIDLEPGDEDEDFLETDEERINRKS